MTLTSPTPTYNQSAEAARNSVIELADKANQKRNADHEITTRLILHSPNGSRWSVTVDDAGVLAAVSI